MQSLLPQGLGKLQNECCTTTIIYIGADNLFSEFKKNCSHDIKKISKLIEDNIFFINYKRKSSEPDHDSDIKFIKAIASDDSEKYCTELLKIVYAIRCSMFHGEKEYSTIQMELLQPTTEILEILINEFLKIINYSK